MPNNRFKNKKINRAVSRPKGARHSSGPKPSLALLEKRLAQAEIELTPKQLEQLWRYHNLLRKRNQDRDLTRLIGFETIVLKHYIDCLCLTQHVEFPSPLLDIGTGAGFPGIPLKIQNPDLEITLAEPRPKRVRFLKDVISELKLSTIEVFDHKVSSASFSKPIKGVTTRALETIDKTLLRTSGSLEKGGLAIFMKGPNVDPEIKDVKKRFYGQFKLVQDSSYRLSNSDQKRRIIVFEKLVDRTQ